jgi:hypothetical protein
MPYHNRRWVDKLKARDLFEIHNFMICTEIRDICHEFEQHALGDPDPAEAFHLFNGMNAGKTV